MNAETCAGCGNATLVSDARGRVGCVSCGAGVSSRPRVLRRFKPKAAKQHQHRWEYVGTTYETGTRSRKERCTLGTCPAERLVEVE